MTLVDADGCVLTPGSTTYEPWRWGVGMGSVRIHRCRVSRGVRMRDPEDGDALPRFHEIAFEVEP